tara:strand:+ start:752 stop:1255 length:504 start_codon:yes stop_codon:yes gene_type:complete
MEILDYLLLVLSLLTLLIGIIGSIVPVIPGPILAYLSIIMLMFSIDYTIETNTLIIWGVAVTFFSILENFIQFYGVKLFGGGKIAIFGSAVGFLVGLFIPPVGFIVGTFLGGFIGALYETKDDNVKALKIAFGSFVGFFSGVVLKLVISLFFAYKYYNIIIDHFQYS